MIRRPPRSTQGVSSAASDVYKRQTGAPCTECCPSVGGNATHARSSSSRTSTQKFRVYLDVITMSRPSIPPPLRASTSLGSIGRRMLASSTLRPSRITQLTREILGALDRYRVTHFRFAKTVKSTPRLLVQDRRACTLLRVAVRPISAEIASFSKGHFDLHMCSGSCFLF